MSYLNKNLKDVNRNMNSICVIMSTLADFELNSAVFDENLL